MVDRQSALRKAPAADVVDALTTSTRGPVDVPPTVSEPGAATDNPRTGVPMRRTKRRMLPFSSKIEMNLRDEMDDYLAAHNITIIDFLDEAIRARLDR